MEENIEELVNINSRHLQEPLSIGRVLGKFTADETGPGLIITAGVHGNEPSGIIAFKNVWQSLMRMQPRFKGELTGLAGNLAALSRNARLIDRDLNRVCFVENEEKLKAGIQLHYHESREFLALVREIQSAQHEGISRIYFLDLHTTSSASQPYISVNRGIDSYRFANEFPLPVVKGIEDYIPGHVDYYLNHKGHVGCTVEAGQHDAFTSIENHEAAIWLALVYIGCLGKEDIPEFEAHYQRLKKLGAGLPSSYEVIYRYEIGKEEVFKMNPDYVNFQKVSKGEILARSDGRNIVSEWDARIFMPLYQAEGTDGFFIVQEC